MTIPTTAPVRLTWGKPRNQPDAPDQLLIGGFAEPVKSIAELLGAAEPQAHAYQQLGIANRTWHRWKSRGEQAHDADDTSPRERPYREFFHLVSTSHAEGCAKRFLNIVRAGTPHDEVEEHETERAVVVKDYENGKVVGEHIEMRTEKRRVVKHGVVDWKADAWVLGKAMPRLYGEAAQRVEVTGPDGGAVEIDVDAMRAEAERLVDDLTERRRKRTG